MSTHVQACVISEYVHVDRYKLYSVDVLIYFQHLGKYVWYQRVTAEYVLLYQIFCTRTYSKVGLTCLRILYCLDFGYWYILYRYRFVVHTEGYTIS